MNQTSEPQLDAPGAGLPPIELFVGRILFSLRCAVTSRERASAYFQREREAIRALVARCDPEAGTERVLIPRGRGMEDSSRYWSVWMTLDHLRIVNESMAGVIRALTNGVMPEGKASTATVKPSPTASAEVITGYEQACDVVLAGAAEARDLHTPLRYPHPWFGPLDAAGWHTLAGGHMGIHRRQIEQILVGLDTVRRGAPHKKVPDGRCRLRRRCVWGVGVALSITLLRFSTVAAETNNPPFTAETLFDGKALNGDVDVLEHAYKAMHPGLYRYLAPSEVDLRFALLRERFQKGASLAEVYGALAEFAAEIRCGHTYPNFYNQPKEIVAALFMGQNRLPFDFLWLNDRMVVTRNLSTNPDLKPGDTIQEINGVRTDTILARLMKLARADGHNDAKRRALLQVRGTSRFEPFDVYYSLCYPLKGTNFVLNVLPSHSTESRSITVTPLTFEERVAAMQVPAEGSDQVWKFSYLNSCTAVLKMPTWALYNSKWNWTEFLDRTFDELAAKPGMNLIIDLRDNEGGLTAVGDRILSRLIKDKMSVGAMNRYVRYRNTPKSLMPYCATWDRSFFDWATNAVEPQFRPQAGAVLYRLSRPDDGASGDVIMPRPPRFAGKVAVLMNSENSSATFQFEQLAQANHLATLVGQPSGGNRRGINGDAFVFLHLPNTKIEMDLPLVARLPETAQPDCGLEPDVEVTITRESIAVGRDEMLVAALKFLCAETP